MRLGRVYLWTPDPADQAGGRVALASIALARLDDDIGLCGRFVQVRNGGMLNFADDRSRFATRPIPDAQPDANGDFLFDPCLGGPRADAAQIIDTRVRGRYIQASHFAEVNTYFHIDRMASYMDELLEELGAQALPRVIAVVHAHNGCGEESGVCDGFIRRGRWAPFQGGHYRLPSSTYDIPERNPIASEGEIHLGAGRRKLDRGALAMAAGQPYRHNAGHNAGIIYHEYAHHVIRHTADFRTNSLRPIDRQSNRKVAMDEGTCDYLAAVMLQSPHIWALHRSWPHRRSLSSLKTMKDYVRGPNRDPHANGTIWAAALWDFRNRLIASAHNGGRLADQIVLQGLLIIGQRFGSDRGETCRLRSRFSTGLAALLQAEQKICAGKWSHMLIESFAARGIHQRRDVEVAP